MLLSNGGLGKGADILNYNGMAKLFLSSFVLKMIPLIEELFSKEVNLKFFQEDGMRVKISFHKKEKKTYLQKGSHRHVECTAVDRFPEIFVFSFFL